MFAAISEHAAERSFRSTNVLDRLKSLHPQAIDLSLGRVHRLLAELGHPERHLPPVVHVAGTNGKGSTIAFLRAMAKAHGKRAHAYTSPHLVSFHERIVLGDEYGGAPIEEDDLLNSLYRAEIANKAEPITLFEITTVAAFLAFANIGADLLLLETGMGGRLDATNVVESPAATVITPISLDHVAFLGETIAAIAHEKAGILKPGTPCIVGPQPDEAMKVIEARAKHLGVPLIVYGRDFWSSVKNGRFQFDSKSITCDLPLPNLLGDHQLENAATAIATANIIFGPHLDFNALTEAVGRADWPARLQKLAPGSLHKFVSQETEIWLDGGHNPAGANAIAKTIDKMRWSSPVHLIWGMLETKDARSVIGAFKDNVDHVFTVPIPDEPNAFTARELSNLAYDAGLKATPTNGIRHALMESQAMAPRSHILICGSLYLAGRALKLHGSDREQTRDQASKVNGYEHLALR